MALTEYFVNLVSIVFATLFVYLHAVVGSLGALNMEVNLTVLLIAFDCSADIDTFLTTDYATNAELLEIQSIHPHRCFRCDLRPLCPHRATVMHPVIQRVSYWCLGILQPRLIPLNKVTVVLRDTVVIALMIIKIELKLILDLHDLLVILQFGHPLLIDWLLLRLGILIVILLLVEVHVDFLVVVELSLENFGELTIVFEAQVHLLLVDVIGLHIVFALA